MDHVTTKTQEMVERIKSGELPDAAFATLKTPCPRCGGEIREKYKKFECQKCDYKLWKVVASRQWETEEMDELLTNGVIGPVQGFRSKMGRAFAAMVKLNAEKMPEFDFGNSNEADADEVDFSTQQSLGPCPKCSARVFEHGMSYVCEKSVGPNKTCDFRSGKIILQQEMSRAEMEKLLETGRTSLLKGFVSSRTRRKFSAYLVRDPASGKVGFEFEVRAAKAPKTPKAAADASSSEVVESTIAVKAAKKASAATTRVKTKIAKPAATVAKKRASAK